MSKIRFSITNHPLKYYEPREIIRPHIIQKHSLPNSPHPTIPKLFKAKEQERLLEKFKLQRSDLGEVYDIASLRPTTPSILIKNNWEHYTDYAKIPFAIYSGNITLLKQLLANKACTAEVLSPMINIGKVVTKSPEMAVMLIEKGVEVNVNIDQQPLLAYAIEHKHQVMIDALLQREDIDINQVVVETKESQHTYTTLLAYAIKNKDFTTAIKLLAKQELNILTSQIIAESSSNIIKQQTIVEVAADADNADLLSAIVQHKSISAEMLQKNIKLEEWIITSPEVALQLVKKGVDCNIDVKIDNISQSLLSYAVKIDNSSLVQAIFVSKNLCFVQSDAKLSPVQIVHEYLSKKQFLILIKEHSFLVSKILHHYAKMAWCDELKYYAEIIKEVYPDAINSLDEQGYGLAHHLIYSPQTLYWILRNGYNTRKEDEAIPVKLAKALMQAQNVEVKDWELVIKIVKQAGPNGLPKFNVNYKIADQRLMDMVSDLYRNNKIAYTAVDQLVQQLRTLGSVEPEAQIIRNTNIYILDRFSYTEGYQLISLLNVTLSKITKTFQDQSSVTLAQWFLDNSREVKAEHWSPHTIMVHSIMTIEFTKLLKANKCDTTNSNHYHYGLKERIIKPWIEKIKIGSVVDEFVNESLHNWQNLIQQGIEYCIREFFDQVTTSKSIVEMRELIENAVNKASTVFGDFTSADWEIINLCYTKIIVRDETQALEFLKLLKACCKLSYNIKEMIRDIIETKMLDELFKDIDIKIESVESIVYQEEDREELPVITEHPEYNEVDLEGLVLSDIEIQN